MELWQWILIGVVITLFFMVLDFLLDRKERLKEEERERNCAQWDEEVRQRFLDNYEKYTTLETNPWVSESLKKKYIKALDKDFLLKVHTQYIEEHPDRIHDGYMYWQELHRYLFMAGIFKQMEMFSEEMDHIWHIMLEHKVEYELFCHKFVGRVIEHKPHGEKAHKPKERALQDLLYLMLFPLDSTNVHVLGSFLAKDRNDDLLDWCREFQQSTAVELEKRLLLPDTSPRAQDLLHSLVARIKEGLLFDKREAEKARTRNGFIKEPVHRKQGADCSGTLLSQVQVALFGVEWSVIEEETAEREREMAKKEAELYQENLSKLQAESQRGSDSGSYAIWGGSSSNSSSGSSSNYDDYSGSSSSCSSGSGSSGGSGSSCSSCSS